MSSTNKNHNQRTTNVHTRFINKIFHRTTTKTNITKIASSQKHSKNSISIFNLKSLQKANRIKIFSLSTNSKWTSRLLLLLHTHVVAVIKNFNSAINCINILKNVSLKKSAFCISQKLKFSLSILKHRRIQISNTTFVFDNTSNCWRV